MLNEDDYLSADAYDEFIGDPGLSDANDGGNDGNKKCDAGFAPDAHNADNEQFGIQNVIGI